MMDLVLRLALWAASGLTFSPNVTLLEIPRFWREAGGDGWHIAGGWLEL